jgi:hypothetical protein
MKTARILAVVPLALMALMDLGYPFGSDPEPRAWAAAVVVALGAAGLVASYGLLRNRAWGVPAALAVAAADVVGGLVGVAADEEGAVVGLGVSAVALALVLVLVAGTRGHRAEPA